MSTDADRAAAEKAEADKKAAEDAAAAVTATTTAWPIGGYTSLIPLVFLSVVAVLAICVDVSTICVVHALLDRNQYVTNAVHVMLMIYSWINLIEKLPIFLSDGISWKNLPPLGEMWMANELGGDNHGCSVSSPIFHNLKSLELSNISSLNKWVGCGTCPLFFHLEVLKIRNFPELIELPFSHPPTCCQAQRDEKISWFPKLWKLLIVECPKLVSFPPIPWRTGAPCSAYIARAGSCFEELIYTRNKLKSNLEIKGRGGQGDVFWSGLNFSNLADLEELCMGKKPFLPLEHLRALTSLKKIEIIGASNLLLPVDGADDGIYRFPVEDLEITSCDVSGKELTLLLSFLPNLSKLRISECENITGLGVAEGAETISREQQEQETRVGEEEIISAAAAEGMLLLHPQLQRLWIYSCSNMSLSSNPLHDNDQKSEDGKEGSGGGLQLLRSLRMLDVSNCPEFLSSYSSSSSSVFPFPNCLQRLSLSGAKYMETLQLLSNLSSLTECELFFELRGLDGLWPLLSHGCLAKLVINSGLVCAWDPSILTPICSNPLHLQTGSNTGFLAAPICSLLSSTLTKLDLSLENEMKCFTKEQEEALQAPAPHLPPGAAIFRIQQRAALPLEAAVPPCRATQADQPQETTDLRVFIHPVATQPSELSAGISDSRLLCTPVAAREPPEFSGKTGDLQLLCHQVAAKQPPEFSEKTEDLRLLGHQVAAQGRPSKFNARVRTLAWTATT